MIDSLNNIFKSFSQEDRDKSRLSIFENDFLIYGAGIIGKQTLKRLIRNNLKPIAIIDDTPSKIGTKMEGVEVINSKEALSKYKGKNLFVTILNPKIDFNSFKIKLEFEGFDQVFSFIDLYHSLPEIFLPFTHFSNYHYFLDNVDLIKESFQLFKEVKSQELFIKNIDFRLNLNFNSLIKGDFEEYFPLDLFEKSQKKAYIDCGAYDGDTILKFSERFGEIDMIIAYEPDSKNFSNLIRKCSLTDHLTKNVIFYNSGVWSHKDFMRFNATESMASALSSEGDGVIQVLDIDSTALPFLKEFSAPIYIKMDIEGSEPTALIGMEKMIKSKNVNLAISLYHNPSDIFHIPMLINKIYPKYEFYLRQHGNDGMDLVLYCKRKS